MGRPAKIIVDQQITCNKCGYTKPIELFYKDRRSKSGHQCICKECQREYYKDNQDKYKALKNNNANYGAKMREYYLNHRDSINQYKRQRYNTESGKFMVLASNYKRRERTRKTHDGTVTHTALIKKIQQQNYLCAITGVPLSGYHIDHIIPLNKGGKHTISNIQFVTPAINMSKKDNLNYAPK